MKCSMESMTYGEIFKEVDYIEEPGQCYSFDQLGIVQGPDNRLWYGVTSGCSCPGHYHEYEYDDDTYGTTLEPLNRKTFKEFEREVATRTAPQDERRKFVLNARKLVFGEAK